jgi:microcystin-dependent protein
MHWGTGGLTTDIGQVMGTTNVTLTTAQMPAHIHTVTAAITSAGAPPSQRVAIPTAAAYLGASASPNRAYQATPSTFGAPLSPKAIGLTGSSLPHDNMQPYLVCNFCICLYGVFPSRS